MEPAHHATCKENNNLQVVNKKLLEKIQELKQKNQALESAMGFCFERVSIADLKEKIGELEKGDFPVKVDAGKS